MSDFKPIEYVTEVDPDDFDDDEVAIVCMPKVNELKEYLSVADGSKVSYCADCRIEVHIAPSSMAMMAEHPDKNFKIICLTCAVPIIEAQNADLRAAPGANQELQHKMDQWDELGIPHSDELPTLDEIKARAREFKETMERGQ